MDTSASSAQAQSARDAAASGAATSGATSSAATSSAAASSAANSSAPSANEAAMAAAKEAAAALAERDADAAAKPQLLACVGDSITYGLGLADPATQAWPALLGQQLGDEWGVMDLGVSGTTLCAEGMHPYLETGELARLEGAQPALITIMLGSNDSTIPTWNLESYKKQYADLVKSLSARYPQAGFVLMSPTCLFVTDVNQERHTEPARIIAEEIRPAVEELAGQLGARYVDLYGFTQDHPEWFPDNLHPNAEGHQAIAGYLFEQLWGAGA